MAWRYHGKARVDPNSPRAFAVDDRTGFWTNMCELVNQHDFRGPTLQALNIYTLPQYLDRPCFFLRPYILEPDPVPVIPARPGQMFAEENSTQTDFPAPTTTTSQSGNIL